MKEKRTAKLWSAFMLLLMLALGAFGVIFHSTFFARNQWVAILICVLVAALLAFLSAWLFAKHLQIYDASDDSQSKNENQQIRKDFTANVSHELKTPLTSISGYAEMIENGMAREEDITAFAGKIHAEAGRMISLIGDIIQLSELDEPNAELELAPVELRELARDTAELLVFHANRRGVTLKVEGDPATVQGSRSLLEELIYNLCDNAIRYNTPNGSVTVRTGNERAGVWLSVEDTGIGISPEHQDRIFERFYRVDKSRSRETGGTGLGLAIVKHIAEQHKAKIDLQSKECVGTTIKVLFPKH